MKSGNTENTSWRGIKQSASRKAVTTIARRRRLAVIGRNTGLIAVCITVLGSIGFGIYWMQRNPVEISVNGPSEPLNGFIWKTDGVLTESWFKKYAAPAIGTPLMHVDIYQLREKLLAFGQIADVSVERHFPDQLAVTIQERTPILRARIGLPGGGHQDLLVANDGYVYTAYNYQRVQLAKLPFLGGVRFEKLNESTIKPIEGIETLDALLAIAQQQYPAIANKWIVVDSSDFNGDIDDPYAIIRIKSRDVEEILFRPRDFSAQLVKLKQILDYSEAKGYAEIPRIDLRLKEPVVQYTASINNRN